MLTLQGHSFFWFDLMLSAQEAANLQSSPPEFVTLVMPQGWTDLFRPHNLQQFESEVIPGFLARQRWFAAKDQRIRAGLGAGAAVEIDRPAQDGAPSESFLATVVDVALRGDEKQRYFLPLAAIWSPAETELRQGLVPVTLAELRQSPPRRRSRRCAVAGRIFAGGHGGDRARGEPAARSWRNPLRQDAEL